MSGDQDAQALLLALKALVGAGAEPEGAPEPRAAARQRSWCIQRDGRTFFVTMLFEWAADGASLGTVTAIIEESEEAVWRNERFLPRRKPRTKELKLVVSSNMTVRGPMQPWELELLTPLIREFVLGVVGAAGDPTKQLSVVAAMMEPKTTTDDGEKADEVDDGRR